VGRRKSLAIAAVLATAAVVPWAAPASGQDASGEGATGSGEQVTFLLSFLPNVQHIGFLIAMSGGTTTPRASTSRSSPARPART
jgi:ABC-type nitrate/sulfonate/bicarbonate transport system substrate-binding protein